MLFLIWVSDLYHFSFSLNYLLLSFLVRQVYWRNSFNFCLSEDIFISPSCVKDNFIAYRILGLCFFLSTLYIYFTLLDSCSHGFWWEVWCNTYPCSSVSKVFFPPLAFFKISYLFVFVFQKFEYNFYNSLILILFHILWTSLFCSLVSIINFGKNLAIITWTRSPTPFFLLLRLI